MTRTKTKLNALVLCFKLLLIWQRLLKYRDTKIYVCIIFGSRPLKGSQFGGSSIKKDTYWTYRSEQLALLNKIPLQLGPTAKISESELNNDDNIRYIYSTNASKLALMEFSQRIKQFVCCHHVHICMKKSITHIYYISLSQTSQETNIFRHIKTHCPKIKQRGN